MKQWHGYGIPANIGCADMHEGDLLIKMCFPEGYVLVGIDWAENYKKETPTMDPNHEILLNTVHTLREQIENMAGENERLLKEIDTYQTQVKIIVSESDRLRENLSTCRLHRDSGLAEIVLAANSRLPASATLVAKLKDIIKERDDLFHERNNLLRQKAKHGVPCRHDEIAALKAARNAAEEACTRFQVEVDALKATIKRLEEAMVLAKDKYTAQSIAFSDERRQAGNYATALESKLARVREAVK
jgi:chromosome segregation ATPase